MRRRRDIRDVDVEVISGVADANDASNAPAEREPPQPSASARPLDPSPGDDDVHAMVDERRLEERPAWPAPVPVPNTNRVSDAVAEDVCEIKFWRGYFRAAFYARPTSDSDVLAAIARSPYFRHRGARAPDRAGPALAAYEALLQELESAGWERVRRGNVWFADVFARRA